MKITGITLWHRRLPLSKPYWLSGGRLKFEALDRTFVRFETDGGLVLPEGRGAAWAKTRANGRVGRGREQLSTRPRAPSV